MLDAIGSVRAGFAAPPRRIGRRRAGAIMIVPVGSGSHSACQEIHATAPATLLNPMIFLADFGTPSWAGSA